jgi:predicted RND superfamily exporter protein
LNLKIHTIRLQAYFNETSFQRKQEILQWLKHFDETMLSHHEIKLSGNGYFYHEIETRGLSGLLYSSIFSLFIIAATIYWITRNQAQTVFALITYLIPGLVVAGCMTMLDIKWTIALLPLPALLIGLMVDDTIHILWRSKRHSKSMNRSRNLSRQRLFRYNALAAGPALLATTLILSGATGTMTSSGIQATYALGILIPAGLISAYLCNLSLIPALNSLSRRSAR